MEIAWTSRYRDPKILTNDQLGWISHDIRDKLHLVSCPVLLVPGEEDFFVPRKLPEDTPKGLPDAEFVELPGIGHFPHMESPALLEVVERSFKAKGV